MHFNRTDVAEAFGRVLREQRKQRGISQGKLALDCSFDRTYASLLERGLRTPTLPVLLQLSWVLALSPVELMELTVEELPLLVEVKQKLKRRRRQKKQTMETETPAEDCSRTPASGLGAFDLPSSSGSE